MPPDRFKSKDLIIPPHVGSYGNHVFADQDSKTTADQGPDLEPRAYSSTPNLQQLTGKEVKPMRNTQSKTEFRVGRVGLQRSQTWPRHPEKGGGSLSRAPHCMSGSKAFMSTPNLQHLSSAPRAQPYGDDLHLRRRHTWPRHLMGSKKNDGRSRRHVHSQQLGKHHINRQSNSTSPGDLTDDRSTLPLRILRPNKNLEPLESLKRPKASFDEVAPFWKNYNEMADHEDKEFVKALGDNLGTLLIFAGLFSAVNTAFIIEALQTCQPDQADKINDLIRSVVFVLYNETFTDNPLSQRAFSVTPRAFRSTSMFFVSLTFSLTAALGAVMGKQWLNYYEREGVLKPPPDRGRSRQKKYEARNQWHMEGVIETLPTLLQISLFLFLIALVDFLWAINTHLAYLVMGFSLLPIIFYIATTTIAVTFPVSPFQTRLSISLKHLSTSIQGFWHWSYIHLVNLDRWFGRWSETLLANLSHCPDISAFDPFPWLVLGIRLFLAPTRLKLWRPPLGALLYYLLPLLAICALPFLLIALLFVITVLLVLVTTAAIPVLLGFCCWAVVVLFRSLLRWLQYARGRIIHTLIHIGAIPSSTRPPLLANPSLLNSDEISSLQCLCNYILRASIPRDLAALLAALDSLPIHLPVSDTHRPLVESLVEASIRRVLNPWYHSIRPSKQLSNATADILQLLKILNLAYVSLDYGFSRIQGNRYLVSKDADRRIIQELFDALFQGPLDVDSASMIANVMTLSRLKITCSDENLEALYQSLERPSNNPQLYLPYLTLFSYAARYKDLDEIQSSRLLHPFVSLMWIDGEADLDYDRGRLRLNMLPEHLSDTVDEYQFSKYLLQWREGGTKNDRIPHTWFDEDYVGSITKLLTSSSGIDGWLEQLEKDGHIALLLRIARSRRGVHPSFLALSIVLFLWHGRRATAASTVLYLTPEAVDTVLYVWEQPDPPKNDPIPVMENTASYLEEAMRLRLLAGHSLSRFVAGYKRLGNAQGTGHRRRLDSLYKRMDKLKRKAQLDMLLNAAILS